MSTVEANRAPENTVNIAILQELFQAFAESDFLVQKTCDEIPTIWVERSKVIAVLRYLKFTTKKPYETLYDLTAIDERVRQHRNGQPASDFTVVYHCMSYCRNEDLRVKVALKEDDVNIPTSVDIWPGTNWYEREVWDMFGISFTGHPNLYRIMLPPTWEGHPLRKEHPARATEMEPYSLNQDILDFEQDALRFEPDKWGMKKESDNSEFMFLNLGPNHPSVHGVFRIALQMDGEEVIDAVPDIGYHHRAAEKMGERQTWPTYIPYTDRIDYLGGSMNNLPYVLAVEKMAGIEVPDRVKVIRVLVAELYRIASHLVFYGTFAQDVGQLSPVFYMFIDREKVFSIIESFCGARMHASYFRIGGVSMDLPNNWDKQIREFIDYFPKRLDEYEGMVMKNSILQKRTQGVGSFTVKEAMDWGATGPMLRAAGYEWDYRKARPYSGYENFEFDIPTGQFGDCYDRCRVRVEEMRQSLRIIEQCVNNMPEGPYKAHHPSTTPPPRERTFNDIETLIQHFVNVSWGPTIEPGECCMPIEATKGLNSYYLVSDANTMSYRTRIRTPSFAHLQMIPTMGRGLMVADLIAIVASIDFVMADVDR